MSLYERVGQWSLGEEELPRTPSLEKDHFENKILTDVESQLSLLSSQFPNSFCYFKSLDEESLHKGDQLAKEIKKRFFKLNPQLCFLAHGSYGASLKCCVETVRKWQDQVEDQPVHFYYKELYPEIISSLQHVAKDFHTSTKNLVFVANVEFGMNAVLNSLCCPVKTADHFSIGKGDIVSCFKFTYGAVRECIKFYCEKVDAVCDVLDVDISSPIPDLLSALGTYLQNQKGSVKLFALEHISSPTAVVFPIKEITEICHRYGALVMIDGAHTLGSFDLDLEALNPDFYVSNGHKWFSNYRGAAVLYVKREFHSTIHPVVSSWGLHSNFHGEFIWQGTLDYSPWLTMRTASMFWSAFGGLKQVIQRNHDLAALSSQVLQGMWQTRLLVPIERCSSMITIQVPQCDPAIEKQRKNTSLHDLLLELGIEVPVFTFQEATWMRVSFHVYNSLEDTFTLAEAVCKIHMGEDSNTIQQKKNSLLKSFE